MPQSALRSLPFAVTAGVCALAVLGGCDVTIRDGDIKDVSIRAKATQDWSREYSLADGGRVEIVNGHGSVSAVAGPAGRVRVIAVIEAQAMSNDLAKAVLKEISLEEAIQPDHVRVSVAGPRSRGGVDVSYKVTLPADARLEMTGNNGTLKAEGLQGHVKASVVSGGIELTSMSGTIDAAAVNAHVSVKMSQVTGAVRLESTNGRISLEIPKTAKATLNVRSVNGGITVSGLTTTDAASGRRIRTLESQLNGGGPEIDVRVTNGRIAITGVETPGVQSPQSR